jgi:ribosomal protein L32
MALAGRPDPAAHPALTHGTAGEKLAKSWADQLKSHIFIELGTRCNHRSAFTNDRIRRDIKEKMRNKAGWANICKEAGRRESKRANRRCPDCGYHFISSTRMKKHRKRRHIRVGVQDNAENVDNVD